MDLNTYLMFDGNCEAAFKFYEKVLGGKIVAMMTYAEMPGNSQMSKDLQKKIMHARLQLGDKLLLASDAPPDRFEAAKGFHVMLGGVKDPAEADRLFDTLADGGTITWGLDISDRKRAEEALATSEAHFRTVFERSNAGIAMWAVDGKYLAANAAWHLSLQIFAAKTSS